MIVCSGSAVFERRLNDYQSVCYIVEGRCFYRPSIVYLVDYQLFSRRSVLGESVNLSQDEGPDRR